MILLKREETKSDNQLFLKVHRPEALVIHQENPQNYQNLALKLRLYLRHSSETLRLERAP